MEQAAQHYEILSAKAERTVQPCHVHTDKTITTSLKWIKLNILFE